MDWVQEVDTVRPETSFPDRSTAAEHAAGEPEADRGNRRSHPDNAEHAGANHGDRGEHSVQKSQEDHEATPEKGGVLMEAGRRAAEHRSYRALVDHAYGPGRGGGATESGGSDAWAEAVPELRGSWEILKEKYGYREQVEPTPQTDGGSRHGKGGRVLDAATNVEIDLGYARIREVGENVIVPAILRVAAEDPSRVLAGFDCRFKGVDRLKEKVAALLEPPSKLTATTALSLIVDVVRFTYEYPETGYADGVVIDVERLKAQGFELDKLKNTWDSEQYKGINTQWLEPRSGVRFEVQFHTSASLQAKELTHEAYERIRSITEQTPETERESADLEAFQSEANARVPIPSDVHAIKDYRREKPDG